MSLLCVPILAADADSALKDALLAREHGADLVEYRVDHMFHGSEQAEESRLEIEAVLRLVRESPVACIVTCRTALEGGDYDGPDDARIALFERLGAMDHPPKYIDVELSTLGRSANLRQKVRLAVEHAGQPRDLATSLIVSTHDFKARPRDLLQRLERMREEPAAKILKVAFLARSVRDNLELFDLLAERDRPMIALAMGAAGLMSRVLAPKFGTFLTFASLRDTSTTAPGQPTIDDLLNLFRFRAIEAETRVYGVIGWPVEQSLSPLVHNAGFGSSGWNGVYLPLPVAPEWEAFKATLGALVQHPRLDFHGASVTIPHKEHLMRFAREHAAEGWVVDALAERAGAANTIVRAAKGWRIANTDLGAIVACVRGVIGDDLRGRKVAVLGAGGAARAAAAGLSDAGATVVAHARRLAQADELAGAIAGGAVSAAAWGETMGADADVIINCTPIGMASGADAAASPLGAQGLARLRADCIVFDTIYNPLETPLLREARARGLRVIDGAEMFVRQAEAQFEIWTGEKPKAGMFDWLVRERLAARPEA